VKNICWDNSCLFWDYCRIYK